MAEATKDTIYVDIDDEITSIIEKVTGSHAKIIALVLPKRATVLQSVVNMKLLKHRADKVGKNLVLITSESSLMPLAGAVGLHVASTPTSKPEIPAGPVVDDLPEDIEEPDPTEQDPDFDSQKTANTPVGELAGGAALASQLADDDSDSIEVDNSEPATTGEAAVGASAAEVAKPKLPKDKKLKVPNFDRFRLRLILGIVILLLLIGAYIVGFKILPRANIDIKTDATNINSRIDVNLDTSTDSLDLAAGKVPAQTAQQQKTYTGQADASGKQNKGDTASGSVTMTAQQCAPNLGVTPSPVSSGTGISTNGMTFITQSEADFQFAGFTGGSCVNYSSGPVNIAAQKPGTQYNVNNADFSVNGRSDVSSNGSTSGGSDHIVTVIQQSDIDAAKKQIDKQTDSQYKSQLEDQLKQDGLYPIAATFTASTDTKTSANPGDEASSVKVTEQETYTMFGAKESDLKKLIKYSASQQIDTSKQAILDDGLASATFEVSNKPTSSTADAAMSVTSVAGPHLDKLKLAQEAAGKKSGEIRTIISKNPGVKNVTVDYSPFWVTATPSNPDKININFEKPTNTVNK